MKVAVSAAMWEGESYVVLLTNRTTGGCQPIGGSGRYDEIMASARSFGLKLQESSRLLGITELTFPSREEVEAAEGRRVR